LSGLARRPFRAAERAIHCEGGAATMITRPFERIVGHQCMSPATMLAKIVAPASADDMHTA